MITSWTVKGFKSIYDETTLALSPLTVFAGANSSGKSSLIQSILLTAQTLQSTMYPRSVILNGHIIRLGAFDDIASVKGEDHAVMLGFQVRPSPLEYERPTSSAGRYYRFPREQFSAVASIEGSFSFSATGPKEEREVLQLQPQLEQSRLKIHTLDEKKFVDDEISIRRSRKTRAEIITSLGLSEKAAIEGPELASLEYEVSKPLTVRPRRPFYGPRMATGRPVGALVRHFLPYAVSFVYDAVEEQNKRILAALTDLNEARYQEGPDEDDELLRKNHQLRDWIVLLIEQATQQQPEIFPTRFTSSIDALKQEFSLANILKAVATLRPNQRKALQQLLSERTDEARSILETNKAKEPRLALGPLPLGLDFCDEYITQFFTQRVKYLGPLRDDPKPVYPRAGGIDPSDIGFRGEHTAAVLDVYRNQTVRYIPPKMFGLPKWTEQPAAVSTTLQQAVLAWVNYMGVAQNVQTIDKGKLGHELKVSTDRSDALHDLTHVGVGVSQVLPILVLSLLADSGSTLIFEQPELHLHPRVQTRLADFFMSLVLLDKQCVVETHSEYLINRLRYLAATSAGKTVSEKVGLFFVEKVKGHSVYRDIKINQYGVIRNWPSGFFDESEAIAADVLRAGMEKRKQEEQK